MKNFNKRMKMENVKKLVTGLHDKTEYAIDIKKIEASIKSQISFEKVVRVIKFNKIFWLKSYIDMSAKLLNKNRK